MLLRRSLSSAAFSLVEVTITLGIMGIIILVSSRLLPSVEASRYRIEALGTRDAITLRVRRVIDKNNVLFSSRAFSNPGNVQLRACVDGDPATICVATNSQAAVGFRLGYPNGGTALTVSGPDNRPMRFDHMGGPCLVTTCRAEFEVRSNFYAVCNDQQASCPDAASVRVRFQVKNISLPGQPRIPPLPSDAEYQDPYKGSVAIAYFARTFEGICPPFSILSSVNTKSQLKCVCQPGSTQTATGNGQPICTPAAIKCPNNQTHRLIGYTPTLEPICILREINNCRTITAEQICGGVLQAANLGTCRIENRDNEGTARKSGRARSRGVIVCDRKENLCCTSK